MHISYCGFPSEVWLIVLFSVDFDGSVITVKYCPGNICFRLHGELVGALMTRKYRCDWPRCSSMLTRRHVAVSRLRRPRLSRWSAVVKDSPWLGWLPQSLDALAVRARSGIVPLFCSECRSVSRQSSICAYGDSDQWVYIQSMIY